VKEPVVELTVSNVRHSSVSFCLHVRQTSLAYILNKISIGSLEPERSGEVLRIVPHLPLSHCAVNTTYLRQYYWKIICEVDLLLIQTNNGITYYYYYYYYYKSQRAALFLKFVLMKNSTCFGQIYRPSSGVSTLYTQH
jgi:hypothetical protein